MDLMKALITRRSIRHFDPKPVPEELVEMLLRAAMQAPSAANAQPWHFVVMTNRLILEKVTEFHPAAESLHQAPIAILVCGDSKLEKRPDRWVMDCSAATQNILLAAHANDLGAVWLGIHPDPIRIDGIRRLVNLPEHVRPLSLVAVGYPAQASQPVDRFHPERIHYETW
ncbi:MAG TPA: nitroreductase family protein [Levilinea sp.]|nr:nitroreductase family protein [Levilinea sp.]